MEINFTSIENLKRKDWHHEATKYGEYVAFNGSDNFKEIVYNICLDLENHSLTLNKFNSLECDILSNFRNLNKSFRPASNGHQYDWYIKYFHLDKRLDDFMGETHAKIFGLATIFEKLINEKFFKIEEILENIPILNKKYLFSSLTKEKIEVSCISKEQEKNASSSELSNIKDEMAKIKNILESMNKSDSGTIENFERRINQLEQDIEIRKSEQKMLEDENLNYQREIGRLKSSINTKSASVITFFKSVFPRFELLSESSILLILNSIDHSVYINKIKDIYDKLIKLENNIEDLDDCEKIDDLKNWYKITITKKDLDQSSSGWSSDINDDWKWEGGITWINKKVGHIFLCYFVEHGIQKIFLHAGDSSKLENYDPPRTDRIIGGKLS